MLSLIDLALEKKDFKWAKRIAEIAKEQIEPKRFSQYITDLASHFTVIDLVPEEEVITDYQRATGNVSLLAAESACMMGESVAVHYDENRKDDFIIIGPEDRNMLKSIKDHYGKVEFYIIKEYK